MKKLIYNSFNLTICWRLEWDGTEAKVLTSHPCGQGKILGWVYWWFSFLLGGIFSKSSCFLPSLKITLEIPILLETVDKQSHLIVCLPLNSPNFHYCYPCWQAQGPGDLSSKCWTRVSIKWRMYTKENHIH